MSYRSPQSPLRQAQSYPYAEDTSLDRQPSVASTTSTASTYSYTSNRSRASTQLSTASSVSSLGSLHKRGQSDLLGRSDSLRVAETRGKFEPPPPHTLSQSHAESPSQTPSTFSSVRQSLRPLQQGPASTHSTASLHSTPPSPYSTPSTPPAAAAPFPPPAAYATYSSSAKTSSAKTSPTKTSPTKSTATLSPPTSPSKYSLSPTKTGLSPTKATPSASTSLVSTPKLASPYHTNPPPHAYSAHSPSPSISHSYSPSTYSPSTSPTKSSPTKSSKPLSPTKLSSSTLAYPHHHDRGTSLDIAHLSLQERPLDRSLSIASATPTSPPPPPSYGTPSSHTPTSSLGRKDSVMRRPNSMFLHRADSVSLASPTSHSGGGITPTSAHSHHDSITTLGRPELESLGKSSTRHLRTLSRLTQDETQDFSLTSPDLEVVGLRGRRRLKRHGDEKTNKNKWDRNWMDQQRQFLQAYEYLCHIGEAKEWIEDIIHKTLPPIVDLEEALRDGVTLAEVVEALNPDQTYRIFRNPRLQYKHSDNINIFFRYLDQVELPELFRFELIDLYEKKNIPKVIYCVHALSWLLFRLGIVEFRIGNLVGQLEFEHHELEAVQKGLDKLGANMPSFGNMGADFGVEPEPEPEETEEQRIDRELHEHEAQMEDLQSQIRGALVRMRLGRVLNHLWDAEAWIVDLQSRIRGDFTRQIIGYRLQMRHFAVNLQAAARGYLLRKALGDRSRRYGDCEPSVLALQSAIRAWNVRRALEDVQRQLRQQTRGPTLRAVQAAARGFLARRGVRQQMQTTAAVTNQSLPALQAAVRGMLVRRAVGQDRAWLGRQEPAIARLQAAIRAMRVRQTVQSDLARLHASEPAVVRLQSALRGMQTRQGQQRDALQIRRATRVIDSVQAAVRGMQVRRRWEADRQALRQAEPQIVRLQAHARALLARQRLQDQQDQLARYEESAIVPLQSWARGGQVRRRLDQVRRDLAQPPEVAAARDITSLQSWIRGGEVRSRVADTLNELWRHEKSVARLQAWARGCLVRQRRDDQRFQLERHEAQQTLWQAHARGYLLRAKHGALHAQLAQQADKVARLQGHARAALKRAELADLFAQLVDEEASIMDVQAAGKAFLVRQQFAEKKKHYDENMQKVVKIQSFVRAKIQGEAYKSLTTGKNPPVSAVKNFVHLLNDSDFDFNEEVEFEQLRKNVVQQVRHNEMLEQYIDQLDIKIALLVKNKITLDEVVRHQNTFGGGHGIGMLTNSGMAAANTSDLKALNKNSRKKLELYQQLFFCLQTQPQYLCRLLRRLRDHHPGLAVDHNNNNKDAKRTEHLLMGLFGFAQKRREEYYLLKLFARCIVDEVEGCATLTDFMRGNYFWGRMLANYTRSPRDRKFLRGLFGPVIRDNIIEDAALNLESDPLQIYRTAISEEELKTGRASRRPRDVPREVAIKDGETRQLFIDHLRDLREICNHLFLLLEDSLPRIPYGLRYLCRQMHEALCRHFARESRTHLLSVTFHWLWRTYLCPALVTPELFGVLDRPLTPPQKRNVEEVAKVLGQIASGRLFGGENIYLQPLNAFVGESVERVLHLAANMIAVADAERTFDIDLYNDLYAKNKPTLYIKMADVFAIHKLIAAELAHMCPTRDDAVWELMQELGSAKTNESEMTGQSTDIHMQLSPRAHDLVDPDADTKALFMETKRYVLYIIRVQQGANLLDILVKPIAPEDERRWQQLLREDFLLAGDDGDDGVGGRVASSRGPYSDAHMADVTQMSYQELKRMALGNVMRLEKQGRISKQNLYQDILNAIALDIRTKSRRRVQRQRELDGVRQTLTNLHAKATWLEQQRKSYDDYIEQAMATLQSKKGKKRFLLPFTRQYYHQRELERSGRVPKFGSFKYSARALAEKGVMVSWTGVHERDWERVSLTLSCDQVGLFVLEGSRGHVTMPGAHAVVPIEELLTAQFEAHQFMNVFEGSLRLNVNLLLHLLYKKFYRSA